ncbi:hypothetical protein O0544_23345 [Edwardsiella anguillarum]|nr:hypothetical protein [Edwardsiella anguillarum]
MKRLLCLAILLAPWAAQAGDGSWSADGNGRILSQKGMASNQPRWRRRRGACRRRRRSMMWCGR